MNAENTIAAEQGKQKVLDLLSDFGIAYTLQEHPAVLTCEEADRYDNHDGAADCKNLFLTNSSKSAYYLVVLEAAKKLRAKELGRMIGEKGLTFASEVDLFRLLGLNTGAVSPFGLINDREQQVAVVLDRSLTSYPLVKFHPNVNTASVTLRTDDFLAVLKHFGNKVILVDIE